MFRYQCHIYSFLWYWQKVLYFIRFIFRKIQSFLSDFFCYYLMKHHKFASIPTENHYIFYNSTFFSCINWCPKCITYAPTKYTFCRCCCNKKHKPVLVKSSFVTRKCNWNCSERHKKKGLQHSLFIVLLRCVNSHRTLNVVLHVSSSILMQSDL